ncbi:hypothetical protein HKW90_01450 [Pseudomonas aeruginosa]|uniref:hypothetical protein n=1 Tax=Pseudomonas nitroreducens TaxID=46680 RepID=UPI00351D2BBA|nr:hypothetical protein [Pseudomonas aeruginosa]
MYQIQCKRLVDQLAFGLSLQQAEAIVARAYGRESYDSTHDAFGPGIPGLQAIRTPAEILQLERPQQMVEFMRMALNLTLPGPAPVNRQIAPKNLVAAMYNFSNFDSLVAYVQSDPIDPNDDKPETLVKFRNRYGYSANSQVIMGRGYAGHTLVIQPDAETASRFIDQEAVLNKLDGLQAVIVRTRKDGDSFLNRYTRNLLVMRHAPTEDLSSMILGERPNDASLTVSLVPAQRYTLEQIVAPHVAALIKGSPSGRSIILDGLDIADDPVSFEAGLRLASNQGINVVLITPVVKEYQWQLFQTRLIFGFDQQMAATSNMEVNRAIVQAAPYVGLQGGKMQYLYHSEDTGTRYGAIPLIPDEEPRAPVLKRIFGRPARA